MAAGFGLTAPENLPNGRSRARAAPAWLRQEAVPDIVGARPRRARTPRLDDINGGGLGFSVGAVSCAYALRDPATATSVRGATSTSADDSSMYTYVVLGTVEKAAWRPSGARATAFMALQNGSTK